jgi:hypothetical protein
MDLIRHFFCYYGIEFTFVANSIIYSGYVNQDVAFFNKSNSSFEQHHGNLTGRCGLADLTDPLECLENRSLRFTVHPA